MIFTVIFNTLQLEAIIIHQENGIYKKQFAIFPKISEENIVGHINNTALTHAFFTKNQRIFKIF